jgi:hypothetical protein
LDLSMHLKRIIKFPISFNFHYKYHKIQATINTMKIRNILVE